MSDDQLIPSESHLKRASFCIKMHHFLRSSQLRELIETEIDITIPENFRRLPIRREEFAENGWRRLRLRDSGSTTSETTNDHPASES